MNHVSKLTADPELSSSDLPSIFLVKSLLLPIGIVATLIGSVYYWDGSFSGPYILIAVLAFLVSIYVLDMPHLHRQAKHYPWVRVAIDILLRWLTVAVILGLAFELAGFRYLVFDPAIQTWLVATPMVLVTGQFIARIGLLYWLRYQPPRHRAVIVGYTDLALQLLETLGQDPFTRTEVLGFFEDRDIDRLPGATPDEILGKLKCLPAFIRRHDVNLIYITLPMARQQRILELLDAVRDSTCSVYFVPDLFIADLIQARLDRAGGMPVVAVTESPFYGMRAVAKRMSDIILASLILMVISVPMLIIAIGIKLGSPGPVFFKQRRYGLDGREIIVYKFRSMTVCEDGERVEQAKRNDSRITPFGAFLRRTSLDELPQFINVLQGRMSVVGPRPHAVAHNEMFRGLIKGYMIRHKVKPGITGWAQVHGLRGETDTLDKMEARIQYDLDYLRNWSLALDFQIVLRTFGVFLGHSNAY